MTETRSQRRTGIVLVAASAVAFSTAPFFTRLLQLDSWTILFWRGIFAGCCITAFMAATQGRGSLRELIGTGKSGWLVAGFSTLGMVCFIPALQLTSVPNVAIIIATQPFVAAALAWLWLRETVRPSTMIASLVALIGVAIIVSGAGGSSDISGILLACLMIVSLSAMTVAVRRYRQTSMVAPAALSNFLGSVISIPFASGIIGVTSRDLVILAMFGTFQVALGLTMFFIGSRRLPSGQATLISTLETPLMPFWLWLAFAEIPSSRALLGGALVMGAVVADIVADGRAGRPGPAQMP